MTEEKKPHSAPHVVGGRDEMSKNGFWKWLTKGCRMINRGPRILWRLLTSTMLEAVVGGIFSVMFIIFSVFATPKSVIGSLPLWNRVILGLFSIPSFLVCLHGFYRLLKEYAY